MKIQNSEFKSQNHRVKGKTFSFLLVLLTFYFLFLTSYSPTAHAAPTPQVIDKVIRISPVIVHLNLSPDKTTTYDMTIENLLSIPLPVKALYSDFDTTAEDGGYVLTDRNTNSLLSWVGLDNEEWTLAPKAKQKITLTIKTPQKISIGGYYGLLFFQPLVPQISNQTAVTARVGVLMLGDIGIGSRTEHPGEIMSFDLPFISQQSTMPFLLRVKNTSMNFFTAKPILKIKPLIGEVKTQFIEEKLIFPSKIRRWQSDIMLEHIGIGIYTVTMQVSTGNGHIIESTRTLIIFPWVPVLSISLLTIIIIWSLKNKRRLKKAVVALISKED